ncbi:MAG: hypothetical protein MPEBLZ_04329 [Candidatus Methanoperedens nitroreducens]|uniref:Uncharacterized protein n=1 Tax=Candidatus Methanoperedens nitratireducens TaxID=1392998 RepID=A0A0P8C3J5_9EURY|nr:MAG: hypothetical protein MPEBLZ_04329 [Candidatus Methanoperedens sp. BLZ1]
MKTGDSVNITLEFENPFNKSIPIKIQDNNILGNNGLEIQCYEYTLPNNPHTGVSYDFPIQAYSAGEFTLDPATVTYTNPETGTEESVTSGPVRVSIKQGGNNRAAAGYYQDIQLRRCEHAKHFYIIKQLNFNFDKQWQPADRPE